MDTENRRSFVKKSLATSVTISFSGLIRAAHGEAVTTTEGTTNPWDETSATTDIWNDETIATTLIDSLGFTDNPFTMTLPNEATVDVWSWFNPDTSECNHQWLHYLEIRHEGSFCIPQKACKICGERQDEDQEEMRACYCLNSNGTTNAAKEFQVDCRWFSKRSIHDSSVSSFNQP